MPPICSFTQPAVLRWASRRVVANLCPAPMTPDSMDAFVSSTICMPYHTSDALTDASHAHEPDFLHGSEGSYDITARAVARGKQ